MALAVTRNFGPLSEIDLLTRDDWARIGRLARERIVSRTISGTDVHGHAFAPYSEGYRLAKGRIGASGTVNLQLSGEMLRAIAVEPDEHGVTLAFSS